MEENAQFAGFRTGSVFWILFTLLSFSGLIYLGIWGFHNDSIKAVTIATVFSLLITFSLIITKFEIFRIELDFFKSCAAWTWGMIIFISLGGIIRVLQGGSFLYSIFSAVKLQRQSLFASISGELPVFWEQIINNVTIPYAEEMFWLFGLTFGIIWLLNSLGEIDSLSFLKSPVIQLIFVVLISSITFAVFHVGATALISFIIAAMIFRSILLIAVWGDALIDAIPVFTIVPAFALGAHMGNNIADGGLMNFIVIMKTTTFGWVLLILFLIMIIIGILESLDNLIPGFDFGNNDG